MTHVRVVTDITVFPVLQRYADRTMKEEAVVKPQKLDVLIAAAACALGGILIVMAASISDSVTGVF